MNAFDHGMNCRIDLQINARVSGATIYRKKDASRGRHTD
jgi:hypothetical protein